MSVEDLVDSFERDQTDGNLGPSHSLTKLLAHAVKYYGVSPLFKVIRLEKDKFAVSFSFQICENIKFLIVYEPYMKKYTHLKRLVYHETDIDLFSIELMFD